MILLQVLAILLGIILLVLALAPPEKDKQIALVIGAILVSSGTFLPSINIPSLPTPTPTPTPTPIPQPVADWQQRIVKEFVGSRAEAQTLAALYDQFSKQLIWDGSRTSPSVKTVGQIGAAWNASLQWQGLAEAPWGPRFNSTIVPIIIEQLKLIGLVDVPAATSLTPDLRIKTAKLWQDVSAAFQQAASFATT